MRAHSCLVRPCGMNPLLRDYLVDCFSGERSFVVLVNICNFYGFANLKVSFVLFLKPHYETEQCGLACTVRSDNAHNAVGWQHEIEICE